MNPFSFRGKEQRAHGFTILELLLVVGIITVVGGLGVTNYLDFKNRQAFDHTASKITADLRITVERARNQEASSQWGIHFENPADGTTDFYEIWYGDTYAGGTKLGKAYLPVDVAFTDPVFGDGKDLIFAKATGLPVTTDNKVVISSLVEVGESEYRTITVSSLGTATATDVLISPDVGGISPTSGQNPGSITNVIVSGFNFVEGTSVTLVRNGSQDLPCEDDFVLTSSTTLSNGTCPLDGGLPGSWSVKVTNPDGQYDTTLPIFTIFSAPLVVTNDADNITSIAARLNGQANPNYSDTTGWFRYSDIDPGTCNDSFGTRVPEDPEDNIPLGEGSGFSSYSKNIFGLVPSMTYYFCALASNSVGTQTDEVVSFPTPEGAPSITNIIPLSGDDTDALSVEINGNNFSTSGVTVELRNGLSVLTCTEFSITTTQLSGGTCPLENATPLGMWDLKVVNNGSGLSDTEADFFTIYSAPTVSSTNASPISAATAQLNGQITPNYSDTTGWFRYSLSDPGTCNDSFGWRAPITGGDIIDAEVGISTYSETILNLNSGTRYYFCALATNLVNPSSPAVGDVIFFDTPNQWAWRKPVTINNLSNPSALTNYQVLITTNTAQLIADGKMRSDCGDLRIRDTNGTTDLDYFIESGCNTSSTNIWVEVPSILASTNKTIYLYYSYPSATSLSNADATFKFFDDFPTASFSSKWELSGGTTIPGDTRTLIADGTGTYYVKLADDGIVNLKMLQTASSFARPFVVDLDFYASYSENNKHYGVALSNTDNARGTYSFLFGSKQTGGGSVRWGGGATTVNPGSYSFYTTQPNGFLLNAWNKVRMRVDASSNITFELVGSAIPVSTPWAMGTTGPFYLNLGSYWQRNPWTQAGYLQSELRFDNVKIRAYANPEPGILVGNQEATP